MEPIKPCPFCGWKDNYVLSAGGDQDVGCAVHCGNRECGAVGPDELIEEDAIASWNNRPFIVEGNPNA